MKLNGLEWIFSWICIVIVAEVITGRLLSEDCEVGIPVPSNDSCEVCRCVRGTINCKKLACDPPSEDRLLSEDCDVGIPVPSNGPCEVCRCVRGTINCKKRACDPPSEGFCVASKKKPGECCPNYTCETGLSEDCNPRIPIPSDDPCKICRCIRGTINCRKRSCNHKPQDNCIGFMKPGACCPEYLCGRERLNCDPRQIVYQPSSSPCETCHCRRGRVRCRPKYCPPPPKESCVVMKPLKNQCCPSYECDYDDETTTVQN